MRYLFLVWGMFAFVFFYACSPTSKNEKVKTLTMSQYESGQPRVVHSNINIADTSRVQEVQYYPSGKKQMEGLLVNGKRDGLWRYYYEDGTLWSEGEYRMGIRHGKSRLFYAGGQKKMEGTYIDGNRSPDWKWWDENGNVITESEAIAK